MRNRDPTGAAARLKEFRDGCADSEAILRMWSVRAPETRGDL
jgi:hypothetical protein